MTASIHDILKHLYRNRFGRLPQHIIPLGADGSSRQYVRLSDAEQSAIGAYNTDRRENIAFLTLSRHFKQHDLPVPEIYAADLDQGVYLQQDLGDDTLYDRLMAIRKEDGGFSERLIRMYRRVLEVLPRFQITAGKDLDTELIFEQTDLLANSGLRSVQALRCRRYIEIVMSDFPYIPQLL